MAECSKHEDILRRIVGIEGRVTKLEEKVTDQDKADISVDKDLESLKREFTTLKEEVMTTVNFYTEKTWGLINTGMRIILVLIAMVLLLVGVKVAPALLSIV